MKKIIAGFLFVSLFFNVASIIPSQIWYVADSYYSIIAQERSPHKRITREFSDETQHTANISDIAKDATPAVVSITTQQGNEVGIGSGFIFDKEGYILTNKHVVPYVNSDYTVILHDDTRLAAKVVYRDPLYDIAVVKIPGTYDEIITLGDPNNANAGESIAAIGNIMGYVQNSISTGTIEGFNRTVRAEGHDEEIETIRGLIETDAFITPGFSGGPLLAENGTAIGMNVATSLNENASYAIPADIIRERIKDIV